MLNDKEFEFLGIKRWHELGYRGQGIKVASHEVIVPDVFDDVFVLNYGQKGNDYDEHGTLVMDYIRQVVPDAEKFSIESNTSIINGKVKSEAIDWLLANTPDFLGTANHSGLIKDDRLKPYYQEIHDKGCFLVCSAGNKQKNINKLAEDDLWKAIGSCRYNNGKPQKERDYVNSEELDFVSLHNLYSNYNDKKNLGDSFSYEIFMGMCALVQCFFLEKTGKKLSHEKLLKFVIDNCIDLEEEGHDVKTGHGLFILPDPDEINIYKYSEVKMFKDYTEWKEAIYYLAEKGEMESPTMWLERIEYDTDVDLMWFCVKWANAVARA